MNDSFFNIYEKLFSKIFGIREISKDSIFRIAIYRYNGKSAILSDGTEVNPQDLVAELHLRNDLRNIAGENGIDFHKAVFLKEKMEESLKSLAYLFIKDTNFFGIKAVKANTLLSDLAEKIGFESVEIENVLLRKFISEYQGWLLKRSMLTSKRSKKHMVAKTIWMSTRKLIELYDKTETKEKAWQA